MAQFARHEQYFSSSYFFFCSLGEFLLYDLAPTFFQVVVWKGFLVAGGAFRSASGKATGSIALWDGEAWWHVAEELDNDEEVPCHLESTCTLTGDVYDMYPTEGAHDFAAAGLHPSSGF
jgi:hypothetical protein